MENLYDKEGRKSGGFVMHAPERDSVRGSVGRGSMSGFAPPMSRVSVGYRPSLAPGTNLNAGAASPQGHGPPRPDSTRRPSFAAGKKINANYEI